MNFTLQWLFVLLAGLLLESKRAFYSVATYLAIGLVGFPVFACGGGPSYLIPPTFGFLLGFALAAYAMGKVCEILHSSKLRTIQYLSGIKSMRQTVKEIEVNVAYRWFLGLEMMDKVPHFSTFRKNSPRRFKDTDLLEQIFSHILQECYKFKLIAPSEAFVDVTHVKARANNKKMQKRIAQEEALFFEELLRKEINEDREAHGKRPLKEKDDDNTPPSGPSSGKEETAIKTSTSAPESG